MKYILIFLSFLFLQSCTSKEKSLTVASDEFQKYCKIEGLKASSFNVKEYWNEDGVDLVYECIQKEAPKRTLIVYVKNGEIVEQIKTQDEH